MTDSDVLDRTAVISAEGVEAVEVGADIGGVLGGWMDAELDERVVLALV
jgi:hypothetical protein